MACVDFKSSVLGAEINSLSSGISFNMVIAQNRTLGTKISVFDLILIVNMIRICFSTCVRYRNSCFLMQNPSLVSSEGINFIRSVRTKHGFGRRYLGFDSILIVNFVCIHSLSYVDSSRNERVRCRISFAIE